LKEESSGRIWGGW